jgi:glycosyltransferase involved in cell wall biosynthesis
VYYFSEDWLTKKNIEILIKDVDSTTIYINGIYSKFFSIYPLQIAKRLNLNTIIATRGMLSPHALAVKPLKKHLFLKLANLKKLYKNISFHATQSEESNDIKRVITSYKSIAVIPNLPRKMEVLTPKAIIKTAGEVKLIGLGRISEEKGTLSSLLALRGIKGKVTFDLYGTIYDQSYWVKCKKIIADLPSNVTVNYKENLDSEQVIETIFSYHFLLLPSKGENYGHSIVETFTASRPVIISKQTPWKNLEQKNMGYDVDENELKTTIQAVVQLNQSEFDNKCEAIESQIHDMLGVNKLKEQYKELFTS